ncbi:stalk domain-containing protein [Paenibacillus sp. GCM10012306]|uniref:stalk domain-containing protein n=1 Tax=Paenibacillus sp. GCM10012306 TaxID=3317342 RepID=UPI00361AE022
MLILTQVKSKSASRLSGLHHVILTASTILFERCFARGIPIVITHGRVQLPNRMRCIHKIVPSRGPLSLITSQQEPKEQTMEEKKLATVKVNGVKIAEGLLDKGVTYVPVRVLVESLGAKVTGYDALTKTVEITCSR